LITRNQATLAIRSGRLGGWSAGRSRAGFDQNPATIFADPPKAMASDE
jgi:hypothetical protein